MGRTKGATQGKNDARMTALHSALRSEGKHQPMTIKTWETLILAFFGTRSRQSCHDITWAMERLGMIDWKKGESITPLDQDPFTIADEQENALSLATPSA